MSFATELKKELEGYLMLSPKLKQELDEAIRDLTRASNRINELIKEGTVKPRHHGTEPVVRYQ